MRLLPPGSALPVTAVHIPVQPVGCERHTEKRKPGIGSPLLIGRCPFSTVCGGGIALGATNTKAGQCRGYRVGSFYRRGKLLKITIILP